MREYVRAASASRFGFLPALGSGGVLPHAAIIAAVVLWGGSFSAMKTAVASLDPWAMMWGRMLVASACLAPFLRGLAPRGYRAGDWRLLAPMVALMPCLYFYLESHALTLTTSAQAGVISASVPLLVAAGASLFLAEAVPRGAWAGLALSVGGVAWLTLAGAPAENAPNPMLGNLLEFGAMVSAAGYMLLVKRLSERYGSWTLTAMQTLTGLVFFAPGAWAVLTALPTLPAKVVLAVLYLGAGGSLGAFGLYNWGMARIEASRASAYINLVPVVALIMGWTMLGETLNPQQMLAALCVFAGVWLSQQRFAPSHRI
jgi:drug/metabolite transporter (DMT)-like permease